MSKVTQMGPQAFVPLPMRPMSPEEAVSVLDAAVAKAPLDRDETFAAMLAVITLRRYLAAPESKEDVNTEDE